MTARRTARPLAASLLRCTPSVEGLGLEVWGLRSRFWGWGFGGLQFSGLGFGDWGFGCGVCGLWFVVYG